MVWLYICLAILFILLGHFVAIFFIFKKFFGRTSLKAIDKSSRNTPYSAPYAEEMIRIREELEGFSFQKVNISSFDKLKLSAYYFDKKSDKTIIMVHGLHTVAFNNFGYQIKYFLKHNYNLLVINQRTHLGSEGKYSTYGQKESKDVISWVRYIEESTSAKDIYLYGISMGATSVAFASEYLKDSKVRFLILESIFSSVDELVEHISKSQHVPTFLFKHTMHFYSHLFAGVKWNDKRTVDALKNNTIPAIFVHGTKDIVAIDSFFEDNYNNCLSNKYKIIVEGAPHALCALHDKDHYLDHIQQLLGEKQ